MDTLKFPEKIETERLILQRLRYEDAEEIFYSYASKPEVTKYLSWATHQSVEDTREFLKYAIECWNKGLDFSYSMRLKGSHQLIGGFGLIHEAGRIQFGYAVSPAHWNKGYTTEACRKMMGEVKCYPQIYRVNTFVDTENTASIRVLEKCGLVREATLIKWFRFINQDNEPKDCSLYYLPMDSQKKPVNSH
jgi:[ribosomal protein S5]-alanine N-acetyltransferase